MALSADRSGVMHAGVIEQRSFPIAASTTIYRGGWYSFDASGNLVAVADSAAQASKLIVYALEGVDNSAGVAGALSCLCMTRGTAVVPLAVIVAADRGKIAHATADDTLALTSTNGRGIGAVTEVTASQLMIAVG